MKIKNIFQIFLLLLLTSGAAGCEGEKDHIIINPRVPLSRDKLMEMARGREYEAFDRSLDVQVSRLRKIIEVDPSKPRYLQTVWGLGYVFIPDGQSDGK